jgi:hypothetical protein
MKMVRLNIHLEQGCTYRLNNELYLSVIAAFLGHGHASIGHGIINVSSLFRGLRHSWAVMSFWRCVIVGYMISIPLEALKIKATRVKNVDLRP